MPQPDETGPPHDLAQLIVTLDRHGVEYLLAGGAAARAYGATRLTDDVDYVVRRERANLDRLAEAMRELHARLRVAGMTDGEARSLPVQLDGSTLAAATISTWMTDAGGFDVLPGLVGAEGRLVPYDELATRQSVIHGEVSGVGAPDGWAKGELATRQSVIHGEGFTIRAALDDIITAKEHADRPKDHEALPELRATQARARQQAREPPS